ncbi:hypothetical protein FS749_012322 [Ceratobasidium sp. UAMH 11750]|nr:hypothetical protein FS749_012322 [Ceratobasidium sp. UAMH 11750]
MLEIWIQRAGRGAREFGIECICIVMVTKHTVKTAMSICDKAGIKYDPIVMNLKVEEGEDTEELGEHADVPVDSATPAGK